MTGSPITQFETFKASGIYAVGKGFKPSLGHLAHYLDEMEVRENWQMVQIIEAETPTILFRKTIDFERIFDSPPQRPVDVLEHLAEESGVDLDPDYIEKARALCDDPVDHWSGDVIEKIDLQGKVVERRDRLTGRRISDDPVNPKHYNGTECAEIGEQLTPNGYQVLKYCWRLGEKDDPIIELGKARWYFDRETYSRWTARKAKVKDVDTFLLERLKGKSNFVAGMAYFLWKMAYAGYESDWDVARSKADRLLAQELQCRQTGGIDCGRGLMP